MKTNNKLFDFISASFGMHGKTIEMINKRKTDKGMRVSDINYSKDGLSILKSYCDAYGNDVNAYKILEEVIKFESNYGDGTSLLTMLLTYLTKVHKEIPFTHDEIDSDIDYIIKLVEDSVISKETYNGNILSSWINTVCKGDTVADELYKFYCDSPRGIIKSIRRTDNPNREEITFIPRQGYYMYSYMHKKFLQPKLSNLKNLSAVIMNDTLTAGYYKAYEDEAFRQGMKILMIVKGTTEEVDELIEEAGESRVIVARMPTDSNLSYIYKDIKFMLDAQEAQENKNILLAPIKEVQIAENGIKIFGFKKTKEDLIKYTDELQELSDATEEHDKQDLMLRISNILSNDTFDILINTKTITRFRMLRGMIEDVYKSKIHFDKGLIIGGMHYTNKINRERESIIIKIIRDIHDLMHSDKNNYNMKSSAKYFIPLDLLANIKEIYEVTRAYMHSLVDTHEESINIEFKWFG